MNTAAAVKAAFFSATPTACKSRNWRCGQREWDKAWTLFYRRSAAGSPEVQVAVRWGAKYGLMSTSNHTGIPYQLWLRTRRQFSNFAYTFGVDVYYRATDYYLLDDLSYGEVVMGLKAQALTSGPVQWRAYATTDLSAIYAAIDETSLAS